MACCSQTQSSLGTLHYQRSLLRLLAAGHKGNSFWMRWLSIPTARHSCVFQRVHMIAGATDEMWAVSISSWSVYYSRKQSTSYKKLANTSFSGEREKNKRGLQHWFKAVAYTSFCILKCDDWYHQQIWTLDPWLSEPLIIWMNVYVWA